MTAEIYQITYPNGKIYIGMDLTGTALYFGSPRKAHIAADLGDDTCRDLTIRKQILWRSDTATTAEVRAMERHYIEDRRSNDPTIGYNQWPKPDPTTPVAAQD